MARKELILLSVTGNNKPGLTTSLTKVLANYQTKILDIGQSVIHNMLSLSILFEVPPKSESSPILKELLFKAYEYDARIKFTPVTEENYEKWVKEQGKKRYIVTLLGRQFAASELSKVTKVLLQQGLNIDIISRLSGRIPLEKTNKQTRACIELSLRGTPNDVIELKKEFIDISAETAVDIAFQEDNSFRRNRRLVCFDMDTTLFQVDLFEKLAAVNHVEKEIDRITSFERTSGLSFKEAFQQKVAMFEGIAVKKLQQMAEEIPITEGAGRLVFTLNKHGYKTAIISSGMSFFGEFLRKKFGVDYVFANELEIKEGKLTGNIVGEIIDSKRKAEILNELVVKENIHPEQVIAVGDGADDLPMLNIAGLGIAFHAKPVLKKHVDQSISTLGLDGILYLIGFRDREIDNTVKW